MLSTALMSFVLLVGDWPQFRGPHADGHAPGPATPMEWSESKNVVWKIPVPGLGWSSPIVSGNRLYQTTAVPKDKGISLRTMAIETGTGKVVWDREVFAVDKAPAIHAKNSHASPTPILSDGNLYVHFGTLGTAKLSAADGKILWKCNELVYNPVHGSGGSPVLHEGKLFIVCDGSSKPFVAAVDAQTGKVAWRTPRSVEAKISHSFATPTVTKVDGKTQVLAPGPNLMAAYDGESGKELWRVQALGWSVVPQPLIAFGMVIYNHDYDHPELMAVKLGGKGDVTDSHVVWRLKRGAPSSPTPVLVGEDLFFVSDKGIASCVNARTGERYWMERLEGEYSASPIYANGKILFLNEDGLASWIEPSRQFKKIGKCEVPGRTLATPAFTDGAMYLRTDEHLYKIAE